MPSRTEGQRRKAVETVEGCGGSVTKAMRELGCPSRQALHRWLNRADASHGRRAGRPWGHCDPALRERVVAFVRLDMAGRDVAETPGVPGAAAVCNWARVAEDPGPAAKVLKAASPDSLTNREKALVIDGSRATAGRSLEEPAVSLRTSKGSHEHRRRALGWPDKYVGPRACARRSREPTGHVGAATLPTG